MIPEFDDNILPEGIHECTFEEIDERFARFQRSDRRIQLTKRLRDYIKAVRQSGIATELLIDGGYVTAKEEPSDIDIILVLRPDFDLASPLQPFEYNVLSRRMVKGHYKFDVVADKEGGPAYQSYLNLFSQVNRTKPGLQTSKERKGLLRIRL